MKRFIKAVVVLIAATALAFTAFIFWSINGTIPRHAYEHGHVLVTDGPVPEPATEFTIVTYNIGYASGLANNSPENPSSQEYAANLDAIATALKQLNPHVVCYQEIDYNSKRSHHQDQLQYIADQLRHPYRAQAYNWDVRYLPFPYWPPAVHYGPILSGQAVSSVYPIIHHEKVTLPKPAENKWWYNLYYLDRAVQIVRLEIGDRTLTILNVHLEAWGQTTREQQAIIVAELVKQYDRRPLILIGDFNAIPPWSQLNLAPEHDPQTGERPIDTTLAVIMDRTGLQKAIPEEEYEADREPLHFTYSSGQPAVNIDHIFYNHHIQRLTARVIQDAGTGSDHFPVAMTFQFAHGAQQPEEIPEQPARTFIQR